MDAAGWIAGTGRAGLILDHATEEGLRERRKFSARGLVNALYHVRPGLHVDSSIADRGVIKNLGDHRLTVTLCCGARSGCSPETGHCDFQGLTRPFADDT